MYRYTYRYRVCVLITPKLVSPLLLVSSQSVFRQELQEDGQDDSVLSEQPQSKGKREDDHGVQPADPNATVASSSQGLKRSLEDGQDDPLLSEHPQRKRKREDQNDGSPATICL